MTEEIKKFLTEKIRREFAACGIPAECNCKIPEDVFITMRDGVRLHTWICFPDSAREKFPVILTRTCYPDNEFMYRIYGEELARRGYGFVWQYVRGREQSEGDWIPNIYERNDGIDTVCWLDMQPWCEILGYWGHSYTAMAGWAMADAVEGKMASMYLEDYGTDRFVSAYEKGAFRHDVLTSWSMENGPVPVNDGYEKFLESCRYMPQREVDEKLWGCRNDSYREYIGSPKENDPLWQSGWWKELREIPSKTVIPVCVVSGWYDHHHGSSMNTWRSLSDAAKKHGWLRIGAWNHFFEPCTPGREIANLRPEEMPEMIAWFELTLKKKKLPEPKVCFYLIGGDRWIERSTWESRGQEERSYYFGNGMQDVEEGYVGALLEKETFTGKEKGNISWGYCYHPADPVPTVGGEGLLKTKWQIGSLQQPEAGYRSDVLSFQSLPLEKDLVILGKIQVELYVSSDCEDTAFTAKVMEVTPEGKAYNIRSSITTIGEDILEGKKYEIGMVTKVTISMWDIAYMVKAGNRLRIDISSSDFPQYNIHSNCAGLWSDQTHSRPAYQKIYAGADYPSRMVLPIMPKYLT